MSDRLLVSTRKGLFVVKRGGTGRAVDHFAFPGQNVTLTLHDKRDKSLFAALNLGHFGVKLHRSTDWGATWTELPAPKYPEGEEIATGDGKPPQPASLKLIWALAAGGPSQAGLLWCGTLPGGLFKSTDAGQSWQLVRELWDLPERKAWMGGGAESPGIHSICVDPRDPNVIRLGVSTGGVWQTDDGGATWKNRGRGLRADFMPPAQRYDLNVQDVHMMVQCPAAPDRLWVQHHNGIFRSDDGMATFVDVPDVKPAVFGFAVAVHPKDPDTAWFVPGVKDEFRYPVDGKLVVTRTRDGGRTFDILTNGLPQEHAYDVVYRHALDIDHTGNRLAFGSTTGNLWVSENQGDDWKNISMTLPPIHAVEFA